MSEDSSDKQTLEKFIDKQPSTIRTILKLREEINNVMSSLSKEAAAIPLREKPTTLGEALFFAKDYLEDLGEEDIALLHVSKPEPKPPSEQH
ncbi:hypothetical protein M1563_04765 [Patescibacteria group bacterium]|nr:hypothetical protein [Patescibacteria group bacterium]MCL5409486.1 hypothetical protein [Patescibacteria group bacterium]